jgi:predicted transcriptional regulator
MLSLYVFTLFTVFIVFTVGVNGVNIAHACAGARARRLVADASLTPGIRETQAQLETALPSERHLLGLLAALGPLDARGLAQAADRALPLVIATLQRLRDRGLVEFRRPHWRLAPRVLRWLREIDLEERTA